MMPHRIAVTGATGAVGTRVAALLNARGVVPLLVARDPARVPTALVGEVVAGSYDDEASMTNALEGIRTLFMVSGREHEDRLEHHRRVVTAAARAGVGKIVYLSFLGASPSATFTLARQHWHTEQNIRASGTRFVFLRDSLYTDVVPFLVGDGGMIRGPAGEGRVSLVTRDDVSEVAAAVLVSDEHDGSTFDVTGPEAVTLSEAADRLGRAIDRPIGYHDETVEEAYASRAVYGAPDWEVDGWVTSYLAVANGELETVSDSVEVVTGHPARTLEDFLAAHPESYQRLLG